VNTSLASAVESLYAAFAHVPRPQSIDYCTHCVPPDHVRAVLAAVPLRELPAVDLGRYASDVMLTVGGVADFRYFLPRILEIAGGEGFSWPSLEPLAGRLRDAEWTGWADAERDAVRRFLTALWAHTLASDPESADVDSVLCAIGNAEDDLQPYLAVWTAALAGPATRHTAAAHLRSLLSDGYRSDRARPRLTNAFWNDRTGPAGQAVAWLTGTDLQLTLFAAFEGADAEETLQALADIDGLLR
jgi:hypothetical protein